MEKPWRRFLENLNATATQHSRYAAKIGDDIVTPLQNYERTSESSQMGILERSLTGIAKSIESAEGQAQKAETSKSKNKSGKVDDARRDLAKAQSTWQSEAPFAFEKLQQADEARVTFFKDALIRFETNTVDVSQARIKLSEAAMASLLEISPADEAMHFVTQKLAQGSMVPSAPPASRTVLSRRISNDDTGSLRSSGGAASSLKSKFGTLLGRNKRSTSPNKRLSLKPTTSYSSGQNFQRGSISNEVTPSRPATERPATTNTFENETAAAAPTIEPAPALPVLPAVETQETFLPATNYEESTPVRSVQPAQSSVRSLSIRDAAIEEGNDEADAALNKVSSDLRAQSTISRKNRGRRDLRNTIYGQVGTGDQSVVRDVLGSPMHREESILDNAPASSGSALSKSVHADQLQSVNGDTDSIRSGRSGMSGLAVPVRHAEPVTDGVHLSVIETVNVVLDVNGDEPKDVRVTGEAALANRGSIDATPILIKVQSPDAINRLVANTNILQAKGETQYELSGQAASNMTTLFKYQVQPDTSRAHRFLPILVSQKWSTEAEQTSVKLTYRLNPAFGARSLQLQDVEISLGINGVALSCVAKPAGSFVKKANKLVWKLNEVTLEAGQELGLLARFKTTGLATPGSLDLRWKTAPSNLSRGSGFGITATRLRANPFGDDAVLENVMVNHAYTLSAARYAVTVPDGQL
jgi:hypothetical protein